MKVFFGLLLIVNIAFAAFQWLLPYEQLFKQIRKAPAAVELQLLTEADTNIVSETEIVAEAEAEAEQQREVEPEILVTEDTSDNRLCYTIGPIKDKTRAIEISGRYNANRVDTALKSNQEKEYLGVMVYIGGHESREAAVKTANALANKGIRDHIIVDKAGQENILSLGVFGLKKNAERLKARVERMNYKVETEARYRERTIYWLYNEQSNETELQYLLDDADSEIGISQIPTQCLPT